MVTASKHYVALLAALGLLVGGADAALAGATAQYTVTNQFGTSITLDTSSCTGGSISPPYSISNGRSASFNGTTTGSSTLCNARYQSGIYGCHFQISAYNAGGLFASANSYKGASQRPVCEVVSESSISGGYRAGFRMR